jgi:pimeloyl-ACP methyl ester carboxylesterase
MRRYLMLTCICAAGCGSTAPPVTGSWIGDMHLGERVDRLEVVMDSTGQGAAFSLRGWGLVAAPGTRTWSEADSLGFTVAAGGDTAHFRGVVYEGTWAGLAVRGRDSGRFEVKRLHPLRDEDWKQIVGTYRTGRGRLFGIGPLSEFGPQLMLVDYTTGRIGPLFPLSDRVFLYGSSVITPLLPGDTVDLAADGLRLVEAGKAPVVAFKIATRDEEVRFKNDSVTLAGTLTLPAGAPPFPALVLVHGSNALTRDVFGPWTRFFAGLGYAVLAFDKRGTGGSTGDWKQADFETLAGDVLAGVRFLRGRRDIKADRVGLWGASQAGWIMPIVVARAPDEVAFLIVHAGSGTTVREQGTLNLANELRFGGQPESSVAIGLQYHELDDSLTKTGKGFEEVRRFYETHRAAEPWLWEPSPADAWFRGYYRMLMDFDPAPYWPKVKVPVLLFYGELDANVPPRESWPPIEAGLRKAGNTDVTQVVLPGANHLLLTAKTGGRDEYPGLSHFVPGYFDRMADWLKGRKDGKTE